VDAIPADERVSEGQALVVAIFAVAAASWAVFMGVAPLLQVRRMLQRHSSADVSIGYLLILLPGFALWVAYGVASSDIALVIPNIVAFVVAMATVACAVRLRSTQDMR
jgi:MtN3 and saliva related transmembrane protein